MDDLYFEDRIIKGISDIEEYLTLKIIYRPVDDMMHEIRSLPYHRGNITYKNKEFYVSDFEESRDYEEDEFYITLKEVQTI